MVRSHDEKEITEIVRQRAKKMHDMTITDNDIKQKTKPA
jgi:predicted small metal-binding protein